MSSRLRNFKRKGPSLYICSCPACGDSTKSSRAAHCYIFETDDGLRAFCHRCGWSVSFTRFLAHLDQETLDEYRLEKFGRQWSRSDEVAEVEAIASTAKAPRAPPEWRVGLTRVTDLDEDHPAQRFLSGRDVPPDRWTDLYHCPDFKEWGGRLQPGTFERMRSESRLIIPVVSGDDLVGFQGRSYEPDAAIRYITTQLDNELPFLYGLDRVDRRSQVVAVEGPIDSMFLDNAVASCGGVITAELEQAGLDKSTVVAYDNEPRSRQTVDKMARALSKGYRVFVWPESVLDKDFNDWFSSMRSAGVRDPREVIMSAIKNRSFSGLEGELELTSWRKC